MSMLVVMSGEGDARVVWSTQDVQAGNQEALAAVREAERIFNEQLTLGATGFQVEKTRAVRRVEQFDPEAEQTVLVPRVTGG
jgi:hypothetical protein